MPFSPVVSLIIATHSRPHLLPRAIESARAAFSGEAEILIVDDASQDETAQIAAHWSEKFQNVRHLRLRHNKGVAGARNVGLAFARGEFCTFHDDDDQRFPASLDAQIAALRAQPDAAFCYAPVIYAEGEELRETAMIHPPTLPQGDIFWEMLSFDYVPCLAGVFRRSVIEKAGLLDAGAPGIDDWDWWIRLSELFPVVATSEPIGLWRLPSSSSGQGSSNLSNLYHRAIGHGQKKLLALPRAQSDPKRAAAALERHQIRLADLLVGAARRQMQDGHFAAARQSLLGSFGLHRASTLRPDTLKLLLNASGMRRPRARRE